MPEDENIYDLLYQIRDLLKAQETRQIEKEKVISDMINNLDLLLQGMGLKPIPIQA